MTKTFYERINSLIKFDQIRFFKLMEISQYSIISFIVALFIGETINDFFPIDSDKIENYSTLIKELLLQVFILTIATYYIRKISYVFPFIFNPLIKYFNLSYIPSKNNEALLGIIFGISYVFTPTQSNLRNRIIKIMNINKFILCNIKNYMKI